MIIQGLYTKEKIINIAKAIVGCVVIVIEVLVAIPIICFSLVILVVMLPLILFDLAKAWSLGDKIDIF